MDTSAKEYKWPHSGQERRLSLWAHVTLLERPIAPLDGCGERNTKTAAVQAEQLFTNVIKDVLCVFWSIYNVFDCNIACAETRIICWLSIFGTFLLCHSIIFLSSRSLIQQSVNKRPSNLQSYSCRWWRAVYVEKLYTIPFQYGLNIVRHRLALY